ncbi:hypothetical protein OH76DRAFT_830499 [Lentinus brumalis]|uniref:Uncharacterized protein n=1 Tax=Lentinus brumalis TaxID=2498619 RepID=A0A371D1W1_9APHY|nr:hypothetical protein OH76DRAFT_830499 [Polyporus brumalis]
MPRSGTREESPPTHESRRRASTSRGWAGSSSSLLPRPKIQGRPPLTPALAEHVHVHVHVHRRPLSQLQKILAPNEPNLPRCQHGPAALTNPPRRASRERGPGRRPCICIGICAASAFRLQLCTCEVRRPGCRCVRTRSSELRTRARGTRERVAAPLRATTVDDELTRRPHTHPPSSSSLTVSLPDPANAHALFISAPNPTQPNPARRSRGRFDPSRC